MIRTLAIETSCDDTSIGIVSFDGTVFNVDKLISFSQIEQHQRYGGVVPEIASREHQEKIIMLLQEIGLDHIEKVDFISVTSNPGLPGSLMVGINVAHMIGDFLGKKVIEVNHIMGHIFSVFLERDINDIQFPAVVLTASGGHNDIYLITNDEGQITNYNLQTTKLGQTLDDAVGECFDKVSRMLGGPYPGGMWISEHAKRGKSNDIVKFNRIFLKSDEYNFSFSGMKSQVHYLLKKIDDQGIILDDDLICDICHEFQESVVEVLTNKILKAAQNHGVKSIFITGGVSANDRLYESVETGIKNYESKGRFENNIKLYRPIKNIYSTDNAAMIGVVGLIMNYECGIVN